MVYNRPSIHSIYLIRWPHCRYHQLSQVVGWTVIFLLCKIIDQIFWLSRLISTHRWNNIVSFTSSWRHVVIRMCCFGCDTSVYTIPDEINLFMAMGSVYRGRGWSEEATVHDFQPLPWRKLGRECALNCKHIMDAVHLMGRGPEARLSISWTKEPCNPKQFNPTMPRVLLDRW